MAYWGKAFALGPNINKPMDDADVPKAYEALQKALSLKDKVSEKERAFIDALTKRYVKEPVKDRLELDRAFASAMRELAQKYPDDPEALTLYAEATMDTMAWDYWDKENQQPKAEMKDAIAAIERVLKDHPNHIGAIHMQIHAVEAGPKPEVALAGSDRLAKLCPGAGHLVHMPSHIYLRVGDYHKASSMNELASAADESYIAQCNAQGFYPATYYPHNCHFLWYTTMMEGRVAQCIAEARKIDAHLNKQELTEANRLRPLLALTLARFGQWNEVLKQPMLKPDQKFETGMMHCARGMALAGKDQRDGAQAELVALSAIVQDESSKALDTIYLPGYTLLKIARHMLSAHIAMRQDQTDQAISDLRQAVELEDSLAYMEPPFSYFPVRHALGAALLKANEPADAEAVYRAELEKHPHNGWSLRGLEKSLRAQGKNDLADATKQHLLLAWPRADVAMEESWSF
jgi:tetratricopeptide (TPR) repeat protein